MICTRCRHFNITNHNGKLQKWHAKGGTFVWCDDCFNYVRSLFPTPLGLFNLDDPYEPATVMLTGSTLTVEDIESAMSRSILNDNKLYIIDHIGEIRKPE